MQPFVGKQKFWLRLKHIAQGQDAVFELRHMFPQPHMPRPRVLSTSTAAQPENRGILERILDKIMPLFASFALSSLSAWRERERESERER